MSSEAATSSWFDAKFTQGKIHLNPPFGSKGEDSVSAAGGGGATAPSSVVFDTFGARGTRTAVLASGASASQAFAFPNQSDALAESIKANNKRAVERVRALMQKESRSSR